jgi:hypothetical protein
MSYPLSAGYKFFTPRFPKTDKNENKYRAHHDLVQYIPKHDRAEDWCFDSWTEVFRHRSLVISVFPHFARQKDRKVKLAHVFFLSQFCIEVVYPTEFRLILFVPILVPCLTAEKIFCGSCGT